MKLVEGVLESGRNVTVSYNAEYAEIDIYVGEHNTTILGRSRSIPVKSFPLFGRPLVERIRQAVIECDEEIEASKRGPADPDKALRDAAFAALYYGVPRSGRNRSGAPPLVRSRQRPPERGR